MTKALYRIHRSKSLSEIVGQKHITDILEKSLKTGKISHAYLFIGPRGTGKTSVARILAHLVNDFPYELENDHLDIVEIDAASNTGVDNIRALREKAIIAPTHGKYKIYIIDEVHMLSKSAFNALLKILEEPPAHVIFIMATTDAHKVPITITSRSQTFTFKLADQTTMAKHLKNIAKIENINITDDALHVIARRGGGSFRDSISLLDQISTISTGEITSDLLNASLGLPSDELISTLLDHYSVSDVTNTTLALQNLLDQGIRPELIAEQLIANITSNPQAIHLPLLEKLLNVNTSSHPTASLLLAILHNSSTTLQPSAQLVHHPSPLPAVRRSDEGPVPPTPSIEPHQPVILRTSSHEAVAGPILPSAPLEPSTPKPCSAPSTNQSSHTSASWPEILTQIQKSSIPLHSLLAKSTINFTDNTLRIYHKSKMIRDQLDKKRSLLITFLPPDAGIEILDQPPVTDPLLNNLSTIFGNVEELADAQL